MALTLDPNIKKSAPPLPKNSDDACYQWLGPTSEFLGRGGAKFWFLNR